MCLDDERAVFKGKKDSRIDRKRLFGANYMIAIGEAESRVMVVFHVR
jgi:hypothetical protein